MALLLLWTAGIADLKEKSPTPATTNALAVSPDLDRQLARWRRVEMPFNASGLSARNRRMVMKLVQASQYLDDIFWRQSDSQALDLYQSLESSTAQGDRQLRRFLMINGSRFDLLDENRPFVGSERLSPGRGFYPKGLTRAEIEEYVRKHPEKRGEIYSPYTIVRKRGNDLEGIPYRQAYRRFLQPAAKALRQAAELGDDTAFARFLRLRAEALLSDDYYRSDVAWLELKAPKIDVIFGPYETYLDDVLGVKTTYGAAVLIRDEAESQKLDIYQRYIAEIQDVLPLPPEDKPSKRGHVIPMEGMDSPFRAGDLRHGYQAVADSLPDDPRFRKEKGTKKIFFKNFMDARVSEVVLPLARRLMRTDQSSKVTADGYLAAVALHEISHGLGPAYTHRAGRQLDIREAIGPIHSALEEAKADVVGLFGLKWLVDHGVLPKDRLGECYASYVGGVFRSVRYGTAEAHGLAEMMEFNYLAEQKAIARDSASGRYVVDNGHMPGAIASLAMILLEMEARGDRERAEEWFKRYGTMPPELKAALDSASDLPVDIDPVFSFPE